MTGRTRIAANQAGTTLIEVLVAVAIMSIAVVAIVQGMGASVITADVHAKQATSHTVLVSAVDSVKSESANAYVACAGPGAYTPTAGVALPSGWTAGAVTVTSVQYWDGATFTGACPATDLKLQLVNISVSSPDGRATESVSVVKRNPA